MAKTTNTIRSALHYQPQHAHYFAENAALFNRVVAFCFDVIQAHEGILALTNKEALTALERLTHATEANPTPIMPLSQIVPDIPAMFRRAAINAALGSARSFFSQREKWRTRKERYEARPGRPGKKKKPFKERPPVPPRSWNKSAPFYAGQWRERGEQSITLKAWTGSCWSWIKLRTLARDLPEGFELGSPQLVRKAGQWWLHTSIEKTFSAPPKVAEQIRSAETKICAVDLNINEHIACCTVQTVEGTILATRFIGGGAEIAGFRKRQLGRIARNRSQTGIITENKQDNAALWRKIRHRDEHMAHLVSARIVQFAAKHGASILVFEHLGNLKPEKGRYSRRGNTKRAYWMKGRIFRYARYKAWNQKIITSRVNPRNTSRECHRCHSLVVRYNASQPRATLRGPRWCCARRARCAIMPTAMPVYVSESAYLSAIKNLSKKSLILLADVEAESRKRQVLPAPRMPNAKGDHLFLRQGMETATGMAPPRRERSGWMSAPQLFLPNYVSYWSRGYAPCLREARTEEWQKPLGFNRGGVSHYANSSKNSP